MSIKLQNDVFISERNKSGKGVAKSNKEDEKYGIASVWGAMKQT